MTNIHFNLETLSVREAKALSAMLGVLIREDEGRSSACTVHVSETLTSQVNTKEKTTSVAEPVVEVVTDHAELEQQMADTVDPTEFNEAPTPEPAAEPKPRKRRTKAEMEAAAAPAAEPAGLAAPTLEQLRAACQTYVDNHGMEAAIELLKDFDCRYVVNLQNLPVEEQLNFMKLALAPVQTNG